ncbi:hypothetical protein NC651_007850 [Populus alba x Populus x berolinensis]|nr:hypothetical protein NC651_007850 [Populus alba x Populus x berolinensis]
MQIKIQSVSIEFLSVLFPLSHLLKSVRGKTEKSKVMLYSEKEHEKHTKPEMHESFSTSGSRPLDHCGFKTDAQSSPSLFDSSDL